MKQGDLANTLNLAIYSKSCHPLFKHCRDIFCVVRGRSDAFKMLVTSYFQIFKS